MLIEEELDTHIEERSPAAPEWLECEESKSNGSSAYDTQRSSCSSVADETELIKMELEGKLFVCFFPDNLAAFLKNMKETLVLKEKCSTVNVNYDYV